MAVGTPYSVAAAVALTTNTTDASLTTGAAANAGDTLFVWCAQRLTGAFILSSVAGPVGGAQEFFSHPSGSTTLAISGVRQKLASTLSSGSAITATLSGAAARKVCGAFAVPGLADQPQYDLSGADTTTGTPTIGPGNQAVQVGDAIALAFFLHYTTATGETAAAGTNYTAVPSQGSGIVAGSSTWLAGFVEYRLMTTNVVAPTAAYTPSLTTTTNYGAILGVWQGVTAQNYRTAGMRSRVAPMAAMQR